MYFQVILAQSRVRKIAAVIHRQKRMMKTFYLQNNQPSEFSISMAEHKLKNENKLLIIGQLTKINRTKNPIY